MNIAIYCGKNPGPAVDATNLEKGNPGVGGTQYVMLLLAHYLSQDPKYNVSVLSVRPYFLGGGEIRPDLRRQRSGRCVRAHADGYPDHPGS